MAISKHRIKELENRLQPHSAYLKTVEPEIQRYFKILTPKWPDWLDDYIETPEMQRLKFVSQNCGTGYSKLYPNYTHFYSVLDHSVATALIVWNFTGDKKQTLSALFHDISTPTFKHAIDFLNGDAKTQESTEAPTSEIIGNGEKICKLLKRDGLKVKQVANYHEYPIADNDSPRLSSDRLEYSMQTTLINHFETENSVEDLERYYRNIEIGQNADGEPELAFASPKIAEDFVLGLSKIWHNWCDERLRLINSLYADILKTMLDHHEITTKSLYHLTEPEIIEKIKKSKVEEVRKKFDALKNSKTYKTGSRKPKNSILTVGNVEIKRRYLDPLVRVETNVSILTGEEEITYAPLSSVSPKTKKAIDKFLNQKFAKYVWL